MINAYHIIFKMCQNIIKCQKLQPIRELFSEHRKLYMEIRARRNTISEYQNLSVAAMFIILTICKHTQISEPAGIHCYSSESRALKNIRNTNQSPQEYQKLQPARKLFEPMKPQLKIKTRNNTMSKLHPKRLFFCK